MKALKLLKKYGYLINQYSMDLVSKDITKAIEELEDLEDKSCDNCKKGFDCSIFKRLWKEKLRKEGYLMSRKEFDCRFWESINENT